MYVTQDAQCRFDRNTDVVTTSVRIFGCAVEIFVSSGVWISDAIVIDKLNCYAVQTLKRENDIEGLEHNEDLKKEKENEFENLRDVSVRDIPTSFLAVRRMINQIPEQFHSGKRTKRAKPAKTTHLVSREI